MGLASLFATGFCVGTALIAWFFWGLDYSGFKAVKLLFLVSTLPAWWVIQRASKYGDEAQALFKSLGKRVPREYTLVSQALIANNGWARPGLLEDYQRWQRLSLFFSGILMVWILGAAVVGLGVLRHS